MKIYVVKRFIVRGVRKSVSVNIEDFVDVDVFVIGVDLGIVGVEGFVVDIVYFLYLCVGIKWVY